VVLVVEVLVVELLVVKALEVVLLVVVVEVVLLVVVGVEPLSFGPHRGRRELEHERSSHIPDDHNWTQSWSLFQLLGSPGAQLVYDQPLPSDHVHTPSTSASVPPNQQSPEHALTAAAFI